MSEKRVLILVVLSWRLLATIQQNMRVSVDKVPYIRILPEVPKNNLMSF
jgi:hypothetical protein